MAGKASVTDFIRQQPSQLRFIGQYQNSLITFKAMTTLYEKQDKRRGHFVISPAHSGKTTQSVDVLLKDIPFYTKDPTTLYFDQYFG